MRLRRIGGASTACGAGVRLFQLVGVAQAAGQPAAGPKTSSSSSYPLIVGARAPSRANCRRGAAVGPHAFDHVS